MVRRIFRPERRKAAGDWSKFHNEELHIPKLHQILLGYKIKCNEKTERNA